MRPAPAPEEEPAAGAAPPAAPVAAELHAGGGLPGAPYQRPTNLPAGRGLALCDARQHLPEAEAAAYLRGGAEVAHVSDLFRYRCLLATGGWWLDGDAVCLRPLPPGPRHLSSIIERRKGARVFKTRVFRDRRLGLLINSVFCLPRGYPLLRHMAAWTEARLRRREGVGLWNAVVHETQHWVQAHGYEQFVRPPQWFAPGCRGGHEAADRMWFGFKLSGWGSIRKHSYVYDFFGDLKHKTFETLMQIDPVRFGPLMREAGVTQATRFKVSGRQG